MLSFGLNNKYAELTALVVDDYSAMSKVVGSMLMELGFQQVLRAANGREAQEIMENEQVHIVLSDWNMPKMNGLELLRYIRHSTDGFQHVPFIMLTANVDHHDVQQAIDLGVTEYLVKPFNRAQLKDKTASALRNARRKPLKQKPTTTTKPAATEVLPASNTLANILVVDDNATNIATLSELLKANYQIRACLSGSKALTLCQTVPLPDLILLDIMMPDMDGLEVCRRLKSDPLTEHIPVIFISALSQTQDVVKGLSLGAVDYITKPITPEITKARIATHMRLVNQRKELARELDALVENARLKADIERIVSHDFKGPLATIMAATDAIEHKAPQCVEETSALRVSANSLKQMVDNQMLIYQLENRSAETNLLTLNAFRTVNEALYGLKKKAREYQVFISAKIENDLEFVGDQLLSGNILFNLIANAIEAAPEKSTITISAAADNQWLFIDIHNQGAIPTAIRSSFFDKFVTHGKQGGTGIGTYSAKLSAQAQGGDVGFSTDEANGTILRVKMPLPPKG